MTDHEKIIQLYAENTELAKAAGRIDPAQVEENVKKFMDLSSDEIRKIYDQARAGLDEKRLKLELLNMLSGAIQTRDALDSQIAALQARRAVTQAKIVGLEEKVDGKSAKKGSA